MRGDNGSRPLILVSNDDGIDAPGIYALAQAMSELGDVFVAAPLFEQSAVGHAITIRDPVRAREVRLDLGEGVTAYSVKGTPADCVKLAVNQLLPRRPDLVVSGINQGPNTAVNVIYSGTVSAATEAAILGIDSIAFSLCAWRGGDFAPSQHYATLIARMVLKEGLPPGILLNVNVPALPQDEVKGLMPTRQARSRWDESFHERMDPNDQPYYWLSGTFINLDEGENTDLAAIENGYVSVTPIHYDLTAHEFLGELGRWF
jgi:5'-nucleotidase